MPIPNFQAVMLPLLEIAGDDQVRSLASVRKELALQFQLTAEEREALLPKSRQPVFTNRVAWASVYLQRAGLLAKPRQGYFQITGLGKRVLQSNPKKIDIKFLGKYPDFNAFREHSRVKRLAGETSKGETPEETLETSYLQLREELVLEIIDQIKLCTPKFFEYLVIDLLVNMGYGGSIQDAGTVVGKGGDEGIDGIIKEDRLGLDLIYLQAKRWDGTVGRPEIQKFVGALHGKHARKGVFITTATFSQGAIDYVAGIDPKIVLIDGRQLAGLMIDYDVGVSTRAIYQVKHIDTDYFNEK